MSLLHLAKSELTAAIARGVRQCVLIGKRPALDADMDPSLEVFTLDQAATETLVDTLDHSRFDKLKASLFVWLGSGNRTIDGMIANLHFIASLPKGSGILLDYAIERTSLTAAASALDALASRLASAEGTIHYLIQPPAVEALLRGVGFHHIKDQALEPKTRLVLATV
jgi:hypothetical protein